MICFSTVGNLTSITEPAGAAPADVALTYDPLGRLTGFLDAPTSVAIESYAYDATGNRTSFENSSGLQAYGYPVDSHRLASVDGVGRTYDGAGNTLTIGSAWTYTYTYGQAGRMATASDGTTLASYAYTGAGEQVRRTAAGSTTLFLYDEAGQLLGQYDGSGNPLQQYVWLDTLPVGVIAGGAVYHVQPDHLGTPRAVIDPSTDTAIWTWSILGEAFGTTIPNEDPDGDSEPFEFDLRFPGQRFDRFSGLNQNYFRDYEPLTGQYSTSDPIGLDGGLSTYAYALASPYANVDPFGLAVYLCSRPVNVKWVPEALRPLIRHMWVRTGQYEAGMGGECPVPGQNCADVPYSQTYTKSHLGQSAEEGATCVLQQNVDEDCVNELIAPDKQQAHGVY